MKNIEQYRDTFSQIHTDITIRTENYNKKQEIENIQKPFKKVSRGVAVIGLRLIGCSTVYAMNLFGVKDLIHTLLFEEGGSVVEYNVISMQGYRDSNEYKGLEEWIEFLSYYNEDRTEVEKETIELDKKYNIYGVETLQMADRLDEIAAKYELKLHTSIQQCADIEKLFQMAGTGDFLGTIHEVNGSSYVYEDGSFFYNGTAYLIDKETTFVYQFIRSKKGSFSNIVLDIGNTDDYNERTYKTAQGINVVISESQNKSLLITDLDSTFVVINILTDFSSGNITQENLEAFADSIDFSMID